MNLSDADEINDAQAWPPEFPRRGWETDPRRTESHHSLISHLLDRLHQMEIESRPSGGDETAKKKDALAFEALCIASWLTETLVGWAIDHQIGLAIAGLEFVSREPVDNRQHPEHLAKMAAVNSHEHERLGSEYRSKDWPTDGSFKRHAFVNLIRAMGVHSAAPLFQEMQEALRALDFGETLPIVQAQRDGKKAKYRALTLQLKAIGFVEFHVTLGMKKRAAQAMVASAYGLGEDAIRNWELRLRKPESGIGALKVSREIIWAKNAASFVIAARQGRPDDALTTETHMDAYGHEAIRAAGASFRDASAAE